MTLEAEVKMPIEMEAFGARIDNGLRRFRFPADSSISIYLSEVDKKPLLTAEQEQDLAKKIEQGRLAWGRLANEQFIQEEERIRLTQTVSEGDGARVKFTESNLRLVVSVAKKFLGKGIEFPDLIQEGNIGLGRAVEKFDWRRGYKFSTYAYWWVRQSVIRCIMEQSRTIRLPVHVMEKIVNVDRAERELQQILGRDPGPDEIGDYLSKTEAQILHIQAVSRKPLSLDAKVNNNIDEENDATLADFIESPFLSPEECADHSTLTDILEEILMELPARQRYILKMRLGMEDGRYYTLEEIGEKLGLSRERVRQIEAEGYRKLRRPDVRTKVEEYLAS